MSPPSVLFMADDEWDYPTFLTELLYFLRDDHMSFRLILAGLETAATSSGVISGSSSFLLISAPCYTSRAHSYVTRGWSSMIT
jgi:hypothetical protein